MEIEELAKRVAFALMDKNYKIATAAECTAGLVGAAIAKRAAKKNITDVVFDRGGFVYHGRVAALAEALRN